MPDAEPSRQDAALRERIRDHCRVPERDAVRSLAAEAALAPDALAATQALAATLAEGVRASRTRAGGVDALMLEFSLDSREGIALMCVAEALLRIPDAATRDRLIRDKIGQADWRAHVGRSPSLFVNAAAWGLVVTGRLVDTHSTSALDAALASLLRKGGEPLIRAGVDLAMRLLGRQFVLGRTIEEALANARERAARGFRFSFDMLGEAAHHRRGRAALSRRLRACHRRDRRRGERRRPDRRAGHLDQALGAASALRARAARAGAGRAAAARGRALRARQSARHRAQRRRRGGRSPRIVARPFRARWPPTRRSPRWQGLGFVVQCYQKRARAVVDWLVALARAHTGGA